MSKRVFTDEQIQSLSRNNNVVRCTAKYVIYSKEFKLESAKRHYDDGVPSAQVFTEAGFNLSIIGRETPRYRIKDWGKIYRRKGEDGFFEARKKGSGRPKTKGLTPGDRIKRLEAEVAYLKAENDFLAKLRAKRRTE